MCNSLVEIKYVIQIYGKPGPPGAFHFFSFICKMPKVVNPTRTHICIPRTVLTGYYKQLQTTNQESTIITALPQRASHARPINQTNQQTLV